MASTSSTKINKSVRDETIALFLILRGKCPVFIKHGPPGCFIGAFHHSIGVAMNFLLALLYLCSPILMCDFSLVWFMLTPVCR